MYELKKWDLDFGKQGLGSENGELRNYGSSIRKIKDRFSYLKNLVFFVILIKKVLSHIQNFLFEKVHVLEDKNGEFFILFVCRMI